MTTSIVEAGPTVAVGPAPIRRRRDSKAKMWLEIAIFAGPALALFVLFVIVPVAQAAVYSLYNWNGLGPLTRFIGLKNYIDAFTDRNFLEAILHNGIILALSLVIQGPLAILVALLLNRKMRGRAFIRAAIFVPYVLAEAIAALAWKLLLSPNGAVKSWLAVIGIKAPQWLADPNITLFVLFGILTWKYLGFAVLIMLAGLQGIPEELHEAASIDGANWWRIQWHITLPLLGPTIRIWIFLSMIGSLQLFDMVWITMPQRGGPLNSTATMATYMLKNGQTAPGFGSAIAVILFVMSLVIALVYQRFAMRRDLDGSVTRGVR